MSRSVDQVIPALRGWSSVKDTQVAEHQGMFDAIVRALVRQSARLQRDFGYEAVRAVQDGDSLNLADSASIRAWFDARIGQVTEQVLQGARAKGLSNDVRRDQRFARWVWERTWARERGRFLEWFTFLSYAGASCGRVTRSELICGAAAPPLHIRYPVETGECYVWVQARVREPTLGTTLKPDFSLTRTRAKPAPLNLLGTIECKSTDNCRTELVREVYSKMRLLEISHTRMVVDGKLSKASAGACRLGGIDVDEHVFDPSVIRGMDARGDCYVFDKLAVGLEESARQRNFAERRDERERQRREGRRSPSRVDHV